MEKSVPSTVNRLQEISLRLDHLETAGEWIARTLVHSDNAASQTGTLVTVLADDIRCRVLELISELEKELELFSRTASTH